MILKQKIIETTAGFDNNEQVEKLDVKYGLPEDYKQFLLKNDYIYMSEHLIQFKYETVTVDFHVQMLYGYGSEKGVTKLEDDNKLFEDEIPEGYLIIGCCWDTELIVLDCNTNRVLIWDHTHVHEISTKIGASLYIVATSFTEFIDKLEFVELEELDEESKRVMSALKKRMEDAQNAEAYLLPRKLLNLTGEHIDNTKEVEELDKKYGLPEDYKKFLLKHDYVKCKRLIYPIYFEGKTYTGLLNKLWGLSNELEDNIISATKEYHKYYDTDHIVIGEEDAIHIILLKFHTGEIFMRGTLHHFDRKAGWYKVADTFSEFISLLKLYTNEDGTTNTFDSEDYIKKWYEERDNNKQG